MGDSFVSPHFSIPHSQFPIPQQHMLLFALFLMTLSFASAQTYPPTRRVDVKDTFFGTTVADPYRWLEDDRDAEVEAWVAKQRETTEAFLEKIPYRQATIERIKQLTKVETMSSPWKRAGITFFYKNDGVSNHSVLYMKRDDSEKEEVLLDPNTFAADGTVGLAFAEESLDGKYLAFGKTQAGSDWRDIYVMEIATKRLLPDVIKWVKNSGVSWYQDGFYYSRYDASKEGTASLTENNLGQWVAYHKLGTSQDQDDTVFRDSEHPERFVGVYIPERSPWLIRFEREGASRGNKIFIRPLTEPNGKWKLLYQHDEHAMYPWLFHDGMLYASTTLNAPNERVVRIKDPMGKPQIETIIDEAEEPLSYFSSGGNKLFVVRLKDVHSVVSVHDMDGKFLNEIELPGAGTVGGFTGFPEDKVVYYTYTSHTYPTTIFTYDIATGASKVWYKIKAQFDPEQFVSRQVFVTSKDGTRVPMFLLHRKDFTPSGDAPTILYGYGGFGVSMQPSFASTYIPWLENGGVIAVACLRGGGEYGEEWHQAGTKERKQNVFDDAIACAEWLIANKITNSSRLACNGGSNGGLLVGALMTQRPELFRVAIPEVGVMDMLRYHLFTIGRGWMADYGSVDVESEFRALYAYSPYHRLREGVNYPSTMVMTADHDDRVVPAHSFKFAAQLQYVQRPTSDVQRPMLLRVQVRSGHGAANKAKQIENTADKYVFTWHEMGVTPSY